MFVFSFSCIIILHTTSCLIMLCRYTVLYIHLRKPNLVISLDWPRALWLYSNTINPQKYNSPNNCSHNIWKHETSWAFSSRNQENRDQIKSFAVANKWVLWSMKAKLTPWCDKNNKKDFVPRRWCLVLYRASPQHTARCWPQPTGQKTCHLRHSLRTQRAAQAFKCRCLMYCCKETRSLMIDVSSYYFN